MLAQLLLHDAPIWLMDEPTPAWTVTGKCLVEWLTHLPVNAA
jgi:ABC-type transport system involved in cytochrome bd biosynthesis fused ATPase/permease subunit